MFKTCEELAIAPWELKSLTRVLQLLEDGTIEDTRDKSTVRLAIEASLPTGPGKRRFNMFVSAAEYDCGTAMCLGGWARYFKDTELGDGPAVIPPPMVEKIRSYVGLGRGEGTHSKSLDPLYYPLGYGHSYSWMSITPQLAGRVLRKFLETGEIDWKVDQ